jgi:hypothetical protein
LYNSIFYEDCIDLNKRKGISDGRLLKIEILKTFISLPIVKIKIFAMNFFIEFNKKYKEFSKENFNIFIREVLNDIVLLNNIIYYEEEKKKNLTYIEAQEKEEIELMYNYKKKEEKKILVNKLKKKKKMLLLEKKKKRKILFNNLKKNHFIYKGIHKFFFLKFLKNFYSIF